MKTREQAIAELARARAQLTQDWQAAAEFARPSNLVRHSIQKHRAAWAAGALVAGFLAVRTLLPSKGSKNERDSTADIAKKSTFLALLASPLLGMARKSALSLATRQVQQFVQKFTQHQPPS